jgi:thioredoxin 1
MKNLVLAAFVLLSASTYAQDGINFEHGTWNAAVKKAISEKKLIFFDAYTSWCGPCKALQRNVFPDKKLGEYFNANFVNVKFDMEAGEGIMLGDKYPVRGYPTLFFIDPKTGKIVNSVLGYKSADQLLAFGQSLKTSLVKN